jgi:hypothetical protein
MMQWTRRVITGALLGPKMNGSSHRDTGDSYRAIVVAHDGEVDVRGSAGSQETKKCRSSLLKDMILDV